MAVNGVQGTQLVKTGERTVKEYNNSGSLSAIKVFKDVNGDGKEDLYSVTTFPKCFCSDTHETTSYDDDGDGFVDRIVSKDYSNQNGITKLKKEQEINLGKQNKIRIDNADEPVKNIKTHSGLHFNAMW